MAIMQGADAVYWFWISVIFTVAAATAVWFFVIAGRDRAPRRQKRGEETIERYGTIEEDRAPLSKFLILTYIGVAIWAVGYVIYTGIQGLGT